MSLPSSSPSPAAPPDADAAATQPPQTAPDAGPATVALPPSVPSADATAWQPRAVAVRPDDAGGTVVQRLAERLHSGAASRRMLASGYRMVRPLGEGTYGTVWLAVEERTGIRVAIKFFAHGAGQQWQMLQDEVKQLAALDDAVGIVHLKDVIADADPPYYVMSYAEGGSLADRLAKGPLPLAEALSIFKDVTATLAYVHAHGIRHCDLKPGNVLLDQLGRPLVADFGQAHLSNDATPALGTFFYMAPEQADLGRQIPDTRWDVYGLGALFYAMVTGQPPRKNPALSDALCNTVELDHRLRRYREGIGATPKPTAHRDVRGIDRALASIIDRCLELDPKKRLPGAQAVLHALERRRIRRRQRPLLWYSFAAPFLLMLAVGAVGLVAFEKEIGQSRDALQAQVLDSDQLLAQVTAQGMEMGLKRRIENLKGLLDGDSGKDVRALLARGGPDGAAGLSRWLLERPAQDAGVGKQFTGLGVAGADGSLLAVVNRPDDSNRFTPPENAKELLSRNWSYRDWFNGRGDQPEVGTYLPVTAPHISQPIVSKKGRGLMLCISVPVTDPAAPSRVVGVLVGSVPWQVFTKWMRGARVRDGQLLIFNQRGQAFNHETADDSDDAGRFVGAGAGGNPPGLAKELSDQLPSRVERGASDSFRDPFRPGGACLAGYQFFNPNDAEADRGGPLKAQWGVVAYHDRETVLAPVGNLQRFMAYKGIWIIVAAGLLAVGVRMGLSWLLRREERLGHG